MRRNLFTIAVCIMSAVLLFMPSASYAKRGLPDFVQEKSYGDNNTGPSLLLAFATNYGSTYRIAEVIAEVLSAEDFKVDLKFADNVTSVTQYDAVILGSSIYIEDWNEKAVAFLEQHKTELVNKKVAYYCVCMISGMDYKNIDEAAAADAYIQKIKDRFPEIVTKDAVAFPGALDYRILKPKDWLMMRFLMFAQPGNWTDFADVVSWAYDVGDKLK
jgi:menaquinone-dependent protoporphyrinogen oxidase